jgi:hypothetical protein
MTLADRLELVLLERGPLCRGSLARELHKRDADVLVALSSDNRFVRSGKTKASLWDVRKSSFTPAEAAERWGEWDCRPEDPPCTLQLAETFLAGFEELGYVERVNGNGRFRVTERGREAGAAVEALA